MIKMANITKSFGKHEVLKGINLTVKKEKSSVFLAQAVQEKRRCFAASITWRSRIKAR